MTFTRIVYPMMQWIAGFAEPWQMFPVVMILVSVLLSIGTAASLHRLVEIPILNWGRELRTLEAA
jgi:exopolysaccharide production protein ExoZ